MATLLNYVFFNTTTMTKGLFTVSVIAKKWVPLISMVFFHIERCKTSKGKNAVLTVNGNLGHMPLPQGRRHKESAGVPASRPKSPENG